MNTDCKKCKKKVQKTEKAVLCNLCNCWHHISCSGIDDESYELIKKLGGLVMWFCDGDKRKLKSVVLAEFNVAEDLIQTELKEIKNTLGQISAKLEEKQLPKSYAEVARQSASINSMIQQSATIGVVVKPKNGGSSKETEKIIRQTLDLCKMKTGVNKLSHTRNGGVFVGTQSNDGVNEIEKEILNSLGSDFEIQAKTAKAKINIKTN